MKYKTKLSSATKLSTPQTNALSKVNSVDNEFIMRSKELKLDEVVQFNQGQTFKIKDFVKGWVFDRVMKQLLRKNKTKLTTFEYKQRKLAKSIQKNQNIVERYVFAIDKTDGAGYITKLSDNF